MVFAAGHILTAADLNAMFPLGTGAWTAYTPTLTQSGAVTKTVTTGAYIKIGRLVVFSIDLAITGAGTGSNGVVIGLPVAASATNQIIGSGIIYDSSVATLYPGVATMDTASTFGLWSTSTDGNTSFLGARVFTAALASGDIVRVSGQYQSAS